MTYESTERTEFRGEEIGEPVPFTPPVSVVSTDYAVLEPLQLYISLILWPRRLLTGVQRDLKSSSSSTAGRCWVCQPSCSDIHLEFHTHLDPQIAVINQVGTRRTPLDNPHTLALFCIH